MNGRALYVLVAVAVLLGVFFRFYHLDRKTYWEDELFGTVHMLGYTEAEIVEQSDRLRSGAAIQAYFHLPRAGAATPDSLARTVQSLEVEDSQHPPLYYVLGHVWVEVFGSSARAIRSFSAVAGVLAIPAAFWLGMELSGSRRLAAVFAALVALCPFDVLYAQEAREYALWTTLVLVMSAAFLRACRRQSASAWAIYGSSLAIALYVYPLTLLVALCFGCALVAIPELRTRARMSGYATSSIIAVVTFAPWLRFIVADLVRTRGVPQGMSSIMTSHLSLGTIALTFLRNVRQVFLDFGRFSIGHVSSTVINSALTLLVAVLVAVAVAALWRTESARSSRFVVLGLLLPAAPLLLHDAALGGKLVDQSRYFIPTYVGVEFAVAALCVRLLAARPLAASVLIVALFAGEALSCTIGSQAKTWWNKDYEVSRDVAAVINAASHPLVVSDDDTSRALGLGYYLAPEVALRLQLHCDTCFDPPATSRPARLLASTAGFDHIFLLGTTPLVHPRTAADDRPGSRIRYIDVAVYSPTPSPLGMFLPL